MRIIQLEAVRSDYLRQSPGEIERAEAALRRNADKLTAERRKIHAAINNLSRQEVAAIVRQSFPGVRAGRVDELAKAVISNAHRQVSSRKTQRG